MANVEPKKRKDDFEFFLSEHEKRVAKFSFKNPIEDREDIFKKWEKICTTF